MIPITCDHQVLGLNFKSIVFSHILHLISFASN